MNEWVQFSLTAAAMIAALLFFTAGAIGNIRFGTAAKRAGMTTPDQILAMAQQTLAESCHWFSCGSLLLYPPIFWH